MSHLQRPCDEKPCSICQAVIHANQNGIVCTVPTKELHKVQASTLKKFRVHWDLKKKTACFHEDCWEKFMTDGRTSATESRITMKVAGTVERYNTVDALRDSVRRTVELLVAAKKVVCFTGAGVSVAAGLNTYRGADGIDTIAAMGDSTITNPDDLGEEVDYAALNPTFTHHALVRMHELGKMGYCCTQNCDNLHQKAGFPRNCVSDLHGNIFVEFCSKCRHEYVRDEPVDVDSTDAKDQPYYVECPLCKWGHFTGRTCTQPKCKGALRDTIVNFSDFLHNTTCGGIIKAKTACREADVCLCLGTSLTVYPATNLTRMAEDLVIVNLQETDLDDQATVRVYATSDTFLALLLPELEQAMAHNASGEAHPTNEVKRNARKRAASAASTRSTVNPSLKKRRGKVVIELLSEEEDA